MSFEAFKMKTQSLDTQLKRGFKRLSLAFLLHFKFVNLWFRCLMSRTGVQCNLDLTTLNLVTTCDLVTIFQRPFFNLLYIKSFDLVTVFAETKSVTKSRLHCTYIQKYE